MDQNIQKILEIKNKKMQKKRFFFAWIRHIDNILKKDRRQKK